MQYARTDRTGPHVDWIRLLLERFKLIRRQDDSLGLTLPKNADHIAHRDFGSWLEEDKPDYVLYHTTRPFPFERVIPADPNYKPVTQDVLGIVIYQRTCASGKRGAPLQANVP